MTLPDESISAGAGRNCWPGREGPGLTARPDKAPVSGPGPPETALPPRATFTGSGEKEHDDR